MQNGTMRECQNFNFWGKTAAESYKRVEMYHGTLPVKGPTGNLELEARDDCIPGM